MIQIKNILSIFIYASCVIIILLVIFNYTEIIKKDNDVDELMIEIMEQSYASGQIDAMHGDFRVEKVSDTAYIWIKSPWDGDTKSIGDTIYSY